MRHTPTPWESTDSVVWVPNQIGEDEWEQVKVADTGDQEDAAFIVKACNNHDALVAVAKEAWEYLDAMETVFEGGPVHMMDKLKQAIAKAEGGS